MAPTFRPNFLWSPLVTGTGIEGISSSFTRCVICLVACIHTSLPPTIRLLCLANRCGIHHNMLLTRCLYCGISMINRIPAACAYCGIQAQAQASRQSPKRSARRRRASRRARRARDRQSTSRVLTDVRMRAGPAHRAPRIVINLCGKSAG